MKTPEEIKRDLIDYMEDASCVTEYGDAHDLIDSVEKGHATMADALAYIQQLEQDNAQKDERIRQLEREKEALIRMVRESRYVCDYCKRYEGGCTKPAAEVCLDGRCFEWRGVEEEKHET